jgi:hypothetical protein
VTIGHHKLLIQNHAFTDNAENIAALTFFRLPRLTGAKPAPGKAALGN